MRAPSPLQCRLDLAPPLADQFIVGVAPIDYGPVLPSRPGEFHPEPLTEPAVTVSRRPARAAVRGSHLSSKYEGSSCCQLTQPRLGCPLPLLHGHYGRFITNTEQSAPARSIGTFCLAVFFPLEHFPFASSCRFPSSAQKPE